MGQFSHASCATKVRGIQRFHMDPVARGGRGWSDIAYNFIVCPHGYVFEGRGLGLKSGANGTTLGNNSTYAICALWGQTDGMTTVAKAAIHTTTSYCRRHKAGRRVNGHRDWKSTECPGNEIYSVVLTKVWERDVIGGIPSEIGDLFMSLSQAEQLEMRDKIRDLHTVFTKGYGQFGVPPLTSAITDMYYSLAGVELEGRPTSIRKHAYNMRDTAMVVIRRIAAVAGIVDTSEKPAVYDASKDKTK